MMIFKKNPKNDFDEMTLKDWKSLIKSGDFCFKDRWACDPLFYACGKGNVELAKLLIQAGYDVNKRDLHNKTILHLVMNENILNLLIESEADVNAVDNFQKTPLHSALKKEIIEGLLKNGAHIQAISKTGYTPLEQILGSIVDLEFQREIKDLFLKYQAILEKENLTKSLSQAKIKSNKKKLRL